MRRCARRVARGREPGVHPRAAAARRAIAADDSADGALRGGPNQLEHALNEFRRGATDLTNALLGVPGAQPHRPPDWSCRWRGGRSVDCTWLSEAVVGPAGRAWQLGQRQRQSARRPPRRAAIALRDSHRRSAR
jgi:hypothetical protein